MCLESWRTSGCVDRHVRVAADPHYATSTTQHKVQGLVEGLFYHFTGCYASIQHPMLLHLLFLSVFCLFFLLLTAGVS